MPLVLLLTHRRDSFTIDRVHAAVERLGATAVRVDTDRFPAELSLGVRITGGLLTGRLHGDGRTIDLGEVGAVWMRRLWPPGGLEALAPRWRETSHHHSHLALTQLLPLLSHARWLDRIDRQLAAESKPRQLVEAAQVGLTVPDTLITNASGEVQRFDREQGPLVTKLLEPVTYDMEGGRGDFMYTSRVTTRDLAAMDGLRWVPQIFQPEVPKAKELRVVVVGDHVFVGAIDTRASARGTVDWRRLRANEGPPWEPAQLPPPVVTATRALLDRFGLTFGVLDFIVTPAGEHVFLDLNPAGEWGWLERDLDLPISEAIAQWLVDAAVLTKTPAAEPSTIEPADSPAPAVIRAPTTLPAVLIITHSGDNECIETVSTAIRARGGRPVRMDTDRYPTSAGLSTLQDSRQSSRQGPSSTGLVIAGDKPVPLESLQAVWYRRFAAGGRLPRAMGDTREAAVDETRRTLQGTIASLGCFQLDPLAAVQRTHHKELQLRLAVEEGLEVPRTLVTNRARDAREFWRRLDGRVITKMQHSFAIYRQGRETVVFTSRVREEDLDALDGLRLCPMTFQEEIPKALELRVTIVGTRVMTAAIDSARRPKTEVDWRRDGRGLLHDWEPYELPPAIAQRMLALQRRLGLNYGAADMILTPDGRHVLLEVNPVGEFFWLDRDPGLPISDSIAAVLLGQAQRNVESEGPARRRPFGGLDTSG
ncbi:MAG: MvdC/MvdD family ATP grasp protein [Myxococcota bacterium]